MGKKKEKSAEKEAKGNKAKRRLNKKELIPVAIILLMLAIGMFMFPKVPDKMPTHWNAQGNVDAYSSKTFALFALPAIVLVMYLLLSVIPYLSVYHDSIMKFKHFFGMKIAFVLFMLALYIATLAFTLGYFTNMTLFILPAMAALFFYIGYTLKDIKQNYFIGIKTPWTLASEKVWDKTHKVGSIFMRIMAVIILAGMLIPKYAFFIFIILIFAFLIFSFAYPFYLFKQEKTHKTGIKSLVKKRK